MQKFGYEWTVNGAVVGTGPVMAFNFPGNGMYVVCLKVTSTLPNGTVCEKKVCKDIKVDNCTSCNCSSLNADFGYILNADCSGHFVGSTQSACFNCVAYVWSVDGSMVGTGQIFDYLFTTNGAHIVCLKIVTLLADGQICEQQICKDVIVDCGITQSFPDDNTPVNLYPNPAADELNVEFTTLKSGEATVKLKTIDGKEIMHETRITEAGAQHFRLTIPAFVAAEVIMVEIDNGAKHIVRKVTISKH
jgi:hypothetical protein